MRAIFILFILIAVWSCKNIEDGKPSNLQNFIRSYEGPKSYTASAIEPVADGYLIMGTMTQADGSVVTVVIKTDKAGNPTKEPAYFSKGVGKAIKSFSNSKFTGYIIAGDSIKINPNAPRGGNIEISSMQLLFIDENLTEVGSYAVSDPRKYADTLSTDLTDIKGNALTVTDDGRVIVIGTYQDDSAPQKPFILALNNNLTLDWTDKYNLLDQDYINAKSVHYSGGKIIWASSILSEQGNFSDAYITIPVIKEPLTFDSNDPLGENKGKAFFVNDIKPSALSEYGYGIVGTLGERDGTNKNMFFARVTKAGKIIKQDTLFIDAIDGKTDGISSAIDDTGDALTGSSDGGFILAGTITTITGVKGKGARDILLVRLDPFGNILWMNTLGGAGDETVSAVIETEDEGILVCGTNTIGNYSAIFVIKTNSRGELIN